MNNASAKIPHEVRFQLCSQKCELYNSNRCSNPCQDDCERLFALAQQYNGNIKEQEDMVNDPSHYQHGAFEVIDEMVIMFGMEKTIVFCQLNAWKYRARAPYKNKFEEDMAKANRYLEMAYELQQIRQEYPEADGYEVCALLKGRKKEG